MDNLICENCEVEVKHERDLMDYEDMLVCEYCFDKLRRQDEQDYYDISAEEYEVYD